MVAHEEIRPARSYRRNSIFQLALVILVIVLVNIISAFVFGRYDLTAEKRFTLSADTRQKLSGLRDVAYVKVYLDGDLPPAYKRLRNAIRELLDEFRVYAGDNLEYEFIDPSANTDPAERNKLYQQLATQGLQPTNIRERGKGETTEKILFPGAILDYQGKQLPLQLLKSRIGMDADEMVNISSEALEYEFMNGLRKIGTTIRKRIAFLQGQGELGTRQLTDAARSLAEAYEVDTVVLHGNLSSLKKYQAVIVAKPDSAFSEKDKFILDQFIMNGGKVCWFIDQMSVSMDSLSSDNTTIAFARDLNLDDQLFGYGVRLNYNLVMDLQAAPIPVVTGYVGNQPQQRLFPWYYFPLINPVSSHPIVHNLNAIQLQFAGSVDTVEAPGIRKTVLLTTSRYARQQVAPARVSLNILQEEPDEREYRDGPLPVAVLLEGSFTSNFKNRIPEAIATSTEIHYREKGKETKMIVVGDGDVIASFISKKGKIFPLGYDRYTGETYGNRNFLLNCMDYLLDDSGLMALRNKEYKIRLLDAGKTGQAWVSWVNLLAPAVLLACFGAARALLRRRKYAR
jgi:ABC-2 type transport system permease protein